MNFWHFLTLVLVVAKPLGYTQMSWIWVFCPIWGLLVFAGLMFVVGVAVNGGRIDLE